MLKGSNNCLFSIYLLNYRCYNNNGDTMKTIAVNIKDESALYDDYSNDISKNLIEYLITEAKYSNDDIKIVVNTKLDIKNIDLLIRNGLEDAYKKSKKRESRYNSKQIMFFIIGVMFLLLSTFIENNDIVEEIIIIAGWVAIWEVVDISLNIDSEIKINRKLIKKLLKCDIDINNK